MKSFVIFGMIIFLGVTLAINLSIGGVHIPLTEIPGILLYPGLDLNSFIIWKIRLPRAIATICGGALLSLSGLLLQVYFRNPIVGPFILGISSGATLMVSLVMLSSLALSLPFHNPYVTTAFAMAGSFAVVAFVVMIASRVKSGVTLLIVGLMVGYLCHAVTSILTAFAEKQQIKGFVLWQLGSFSGFKWDEIRLLVMGGGLLILFSYALSKPLNALLLGENYASSMGINVKRLRMALLFSACSMAGIVTSMAGPVAFIGLAVPHMARMLLATSDNRILIPGVILTGASITSMCDIIARTAMAPVELPLSAITAIFGAPVVVGLLAKRRVKL